MNSNNDRFSANGGIGFSGLLTIVFITLKLTGVIKCSWLWVLAPLWVSLAIVIFIWLGYLLISIYRHYRYKKINDIYEDYHKKNPRDEG